MLQSDISCENVRFIFSTRPLRVYKLSVYDLYLIQSLVRTIAVRKAQNLHGVADMELVDYNFFVLFVVSDNVFCIS